MEQAPHLTRRRAARESGKGALNSPEMAVAVEDSKSFLDMDQTPDPFTQLIVCKDSSARPESVSVRL